MPVFAPNDLVVGGRAQQGRLREAVADLDALDGLDRHEGAGQAGIQSLTGAHVRPQAHGHAVGDDLDDAADGVAAVLRVVHRCLETGVVGEVEGAHGGLAQGLLVGRGRDRRGRRALGTNRNDVGDEANTSDLVEQCLGQRPESNPSRRLAGGGTLEHRAGLGQVVRKHAGQVRMPGTRPGQRAVTRNLALVARARIDEESGRINRVGVHDGLPLGPLGVTDPNGNRGARRHAVTNTRHDRHVVGLELLARTAPVAQTAARQRPAQIIGRDTQARGKPLDRGK